MSHVAIVAGLAAVAAAAAWLIARRTASEAVSGPSWTIPATLERAAFRRPEAPWLVILFSSSTCLACRDAWESVSPLESESVAVQQVDSIAEKEIHERYGIDAVPLVVMVDELGSVRRSFVGPTRAEEIWSALAEIRSA